MSCWNFLSGAAPPVANLFTHRSAYRRSSPCDEDRGDPAKKSPHDNTCRFRDNAAERQSRVAIKKCDVGGRQRVIINLDVVERRVWIAEVGVKIGHGKRSSGNIV